MSYRVGTIPANKDGTFSKKYSDSDLQLLLHTACASVLAAENAVAAARQYLDEVIAITRRHHQERLVEAALADLQSRRPS
jgi:hypothetical protein